MVGQRLGAYEILAKLGAGGMGEVYRARDTQLDREVALKILPQAFASDPDRLARFEREAKTLASLNHPNIAHLHGIERAGDTRALVMELVPGDDLSEILARGPIAVADALPIARQIALALEAAHASGVIHRDLKPANIKLTGAWATDVADCTVKVLDFGLAKAAVDAGDGAASGSATMTSPAMTQAGIILGTAAYMSPEQARGRPVDKRADIWAFGCVLYEMLAGKPTFPGDNVTDVLAAVVRADPDWAALPAGTPRAVRTLIRRCLQKDPKQRLHDIADARIEIDGIGTEAAVTSDAPAHTGPGDHASPGRTRIGLPVLAAAILISIVAGAAAGWAWRASRVVPQVQWSGSRLGGSAIAMSPRVSPDGHLIAFIAMVDGQSQIAVMKPNAGSWTVITRDRAHGLVDALSWAADGSHIYYDRLTDSPQGVYSVPALGGEERLVIENASSPHALADGSLIFGQINAARVMQLHRLWPQTGKIDTLPVLTASRAGFRGFVQQLDANRLVVAGFAPGEQQPRETVRVLDLTTGQLKDLGAGAAGEPIKLTTDSTNGTVLLSLRDGSVYRIVRIKPEDPGRAETVLTMLEQPDVDVGPDGSLYVGLLDRPLEIVLVSPTGGTVERVAASPQFAYGAPLALEDGRVLLPGRVGSTPRMLVARPGKEPSTFVQTDEPTFQPMTSLAGKRVALMIGDGSAAPEIAIVSVETGRILKRLATGAPAAISGLGASPDGKVIYYSAKGSIYALPSDGGAARVVGSGDSLAVDPDSGDIIVKLDEQDRFKIARIPAAGGPPRTIDIKSDLRLVPIALAGMAVQRGRLAVAVASPDSWYWYIATLDLASGRLEKTAVNYSTDFHFATWTPDGRILASAPGIQASLWRFERTPSENTSGRR